MKIDHNLYHNNENKNLQLGEILNCLLLIFFCKEWNGNKCVKNIQVSNYAN